MVTDEERYKRVCSMIDVYVGLYQAAFNRFIQLSLATVGGFLWLRTQENSPQIEYLFPIVRWILPILAAVTVTDLALLHLGWRGFRKAEAELLNRPDLGPRFPYSGRVEIFRALVAVLIGTAGFVWLR